MTDGEALIRSVLASPADDAPRLVYADWLEEQGRADDAEFVRVQIELARRGYRGAFHLDEQGHTRHVPPDIERLTYRQNELWFAGSGKPVLPNDMLNWPMTVHPTPGQNLLIRRGFVERITVFTDVFLEVAAGLFGTQPITHVKLVDRQPAELGGEYHWLLRSAVGTYLNMGTVPPALWPHMAPGEDVPSVTFATADEAEAALSWACVRYGRAAAGLTDQPEAGR